MIACNRTELIAALDRCAKVIPTRTTIHAFRHARLRLEFGKLSYAATSDQMTVMGSIDAEGDDAVIIVDPKTLSRAISALNGDKVHLTPAEGKLRLKGDGRRSFTYSTLGQDEFPQLSQVPDMDRCLPDDFREHISRVMHAANKDSEDRPMMHRVRIAATGGRVEYQATDGKRCAFVATESDLECEVLIPLSVAGLLLDTDGPVRFGESETELFLMQDSGEILASRKAVGVFPNVNFLLTKTKFRGHVLVQRDLLLNAVRSTSQVYETLALHIEKDSICVKSQGLNAEAVDWIESESDGDPVCVGASASQLLDALKNVGSDQIRIGYGDELHPLVIEDGCYTAFVLPIRPEYIKQSTAA